jgi:hypothetical protein
LLPAFPFFFLLRSSFTLHASAVFFGRRSRFFVFPHELPRGMLIRWWTIR